MTRVRQSFCVAGVHPPLVRGSMQTFLVAPGSKVVALEMTICPLYHLGQLQENCLLQGSWVILCVDKIDFNNDIFVESLDDFKGVVDGVSSDLDCHVIDSMVWRLWLFAPWQEGLGPGQHMGWRSGGSA